MGRPRKPTQLKILEGDRRDRINRAEPKSPPGLGDPPEWLGDLEREAWSDLEARLGEMGVATRADVQAAAIYCSHYARWRESNEAIERDGLVATRFGVDRPHPLLKVADESARQMLKILVQFGMTPSSRSGLHVASSEENPVLAFLAGKAKAGRR